MIRNYLLVTISMGLVCACAQRPSQPTIQDHASIQRVAIVKATHPPATHFDTFAVGRGKGVVKGAGAGAAATIGAFAASRDPFGLVIGVVLSPVGAIVGAVAGGIEAVPPEKASEIEAAQANSVATLDVQESLRAEVVSKARFTGYSVSLGPIGSGPQLAKDAPDYRDLFEVADAVLETTISDFGTTGTGSNPKLSLILVARSRFVRTADGRILGDQSFRRESESHTLEEWFSDSGRLFNKAYESAVSKLAQDIVEWHLLRFPARPFTTIGSPKPVEPGKPALGFIPTPDINPRNAVFRWVSFDPQNVVRQANADLSRITDIRYDLCIFRNPEETVALPVDCDYRQEGLDATEYQVSRPLPLSGRYAWTVRARFRLDGRQYLTEWSHLRRVFDIVGTETLQ